MKKNSHVSHFWHNVLCISAFTYHLFFIIILTIGLSNISILQNTFRNYIESSAKYSNLYFYIFTTLTLSILACFGIIKLFSFRKIGFYIYLTSTLLLISLKYFFLSTNWIEIGLLFTYLIMFVLIRKRYI